MLEWENTIKIALVFYVNNCTSVDTKQRCRILNHFLELAMSFVFAVLTGKGNALSRSPDLNIGSQPVYTIISMRLPNGVRWKICVFLNSLEFAFLGKLKKTSVNAGMHYAFRTLTEW